MSTPEAASRAPDCKPNCKRTANNRASCDVTRWLLDAQMSIKDSVGGQRTIRDNTGNKRLKIRRPSGFVGSNPTPGTKSLDTKLGHKEKPLRPEWSLSGSKRASAFASPTAGPVEVMPRTANQPCGETSRSAKTLQTRAS